MKYLISLIAILTFTFTSCDTSTNVDSLGYQMKVEVTSEADSVFVSTAKNGSLYYDLKKVATPYYESIPATPNDEIWVTVRNNPTSTVKAFIVQDEINSGQTEDLGETTRYHYNVPTIK